MKVKKQQIWQINQLFVLLASLFVVFALLRASSDLLVPFLIAIAIAILLSPLFTYLDGKGIHRAVSLPLVSIISLIPIVVLGGYLGGEVHEFAQNYEMMKQEFNEWLLQLSHAGDKFGLTITQDDITKALNSLDMTGMVKSLVTQTKDQFSNLFLIFFIVAFMLMESGFLYNKLVKIMSERGGDLEGTMEIIEKIKKYFSIKVKTSLMTAVWVLVVLWFYDIDYAILWATLAFFLNFIPVIGSILAAVPVVILALIDQGLMTGLWIALWYIIINMVIGNILEPRIMGKGLGLSALVIFLSMTFWGWMFGPTGMILSVPLTMGMQYLFDQYEETKWMAFMLSDYEKEIEQ